MLSSRFFKSSTVILKGFFICHCSFCASRDFQRVQSTDFFFSASSLECYGRLFDRQKMNVMEKLFQEWRVNKKKSSIPVGGEFIEVRNKQRCASKLQKLWIGLRKLSMSISHSRVSHLSFEPSGNLWLLNGYFPSGFFIHWYSEFIPSSHYKNKKNYQINGLNYEISIRYFHAKIKKFSTHNCYRHFIKLRYNCIIIFSSLWLIIEKMEITVCVWNRGLLMIDISQLAFATQ